MARSVRGNTGAATPAGSPPPSDPEHPQTGSGSGAQTVTMAAADIVPAIVEYARRHGLGWVVAGRAGRIVNRWLRRPSPNDWPGWLRISTCWRWRWITCPTFLNPTTGARDEERTALPSPPAATRSDFVDLPGDHAGGPFLCCPISIWPTSSCCFAGGGRRGVRCGRAPRFWRQSST